MKIMAVEEYDSWSSYAVPLELSDEQYEALKREAVKQGKLPAELVRDLVCDWLVAKGNLRIY